MKAESRAVLAHVARKRAKGECAYGGCHKHSGRSKLCAAHRIQDNAWKLARNMRARTTDALLALHQKHRRIADAAVAELRSRGVKP